MLLGIMTRMSDMVLRGGVGWCSGAVLGGAVTCPIRDMIARFCQCAELINVHISIILHINLNVGINLNINILRYFFENISRSIG